MIKTYEFYTEYNQIHKYIRTYDGYKETSYKVYRNGELQTEKKNYSYNGLNASWDHYYYGDTVCEHVETEYLDETFLRIKYQRYSLHSSTSEFHFEYDGKKVIGYKYFKNGILIREGYDYNYDGLHCTYTITHYTSSIPGAVREEYSYNVVYLDDTYLREKSRKRTRVVFYENGASRTTTDFTANDYDDKKPIGSTNYRDGLLSSVSRDYHYDGLTCYYYRDIYRVGEVYSTDAYEVEYLE